MYFANYTKILNERLESVIKYAYDNQCMIMVDAEQSYLQPYIDYITAHFFKKYNKDQCTLLNTLQCYLKEEQAHYSKWKNFARNNDLKFGIKLVRGAYMTEETHLSIKYEYPNPVCSNVEDTHTNYNKTVDNIFKDYKKGDKFIIATHNLESIELLGNNFKKHGQNEDIICAQLLGIAEHATGYCKLNVSDK
jgi:proline dehydrogenase